MLVADTLTACKANRARLHRLTLSLRHQGDSRGWMSHLLGRDEREDDLGEFADARDRVEVGLAERAHREHGD